MLTSVILYTIKERNGQTTMVTTIIDYQLSILSYLISYILALIVY